MLRVVALRGAWARHPWDPLITGYRRMVSKGKRVLRPDFIKSRRTKKGQEMAWWRPSWGWFCTHSLLAVISVSSAIVTSPWPKAYLSHDYWWLQLLCVLGAAVGGWGMLGSFLNHHRVIVNRYQLIRATRPLQLFNRHVAYNRSSVHRFYLESRKGLVFNDYRVLVLMSGGRAEDLFVTEHKNVAWFLLQALCGVLRREAGDSPGVGEVIRGQQEERREEKPSDQVLI